MEKTSSDPGSSAQRSESTVAQRLKWLQLISILDTDADAGWPSVEMRFDRLAWGGQLYRSKFGECIGIRDPEFAGDLFDGLARRRNMSGYSISKAELREFWDQISDPSFDSRLQTFFDMMVKSADRRITREEVRELILLSASATKLAKIREQAEEYAALIMEELDPTNQGYVSTENLGVLLLRGAGQTVSQMQRHNKPLLTPESNPLRRWYRRTHYFLEDNWKRVWVMLLWVSICAGLFAWKFVQYRRHDLFHVMGYCVCVAKGSAETLKFNMALVLLPVCRKTITWIRNLTVVTRVVPLNDNLNFHNVVAVGITVGVGLHIIPHLTCNFPRLLKAADAEYALLALYFGETRPDNYWWFIRSTVGWTGLVMLVLMVAAFMLAMPLFRRGRLELPGPLRRLTGFNAFWYSHHCFVLVYALLIAHGQLLHLAHKWYEKSTWMYLAVPMVLYACERLMRVLRSTVLTVKIKGVEVYPGDVLMLKFFKPQWFRYMSGQYIFINCPAISIFQWHPFHITSAPQDNYVTVHIRTLGDWTHELKNVFERVMLQPPIEENSGLSNSSFPKVLIDGPYCSASQDYKDYDIVLLVGLDIGATSMISIMRDIVNNTKQLDNDLESGDKSNNSVSSSFRKQRAYYFYWIITKEQGSFEWFPSLMNEVVQVNKDGIIEVHNYCTSLYEEGDAQSALFSVLQSLNYDKNGVDILSGTRLKTHFARPNWYNVYKRIALSHRDQRVGVFYCGAPVLEDELRDLARNFSRKTTTKFDFHKENF